MLHLNNDIQLSPLTIKKHYINRMDEDYKNIWHFTYKDTYYVVPNEYEVYSVRLKLRDESKEPTLLYPLKCGYKGGPNKAIRNDLASIFPSTWDIDVIKQWCDEETEKTLSLCHVIK